MPLEHGKSPKSFSHNVRTEMHHGHPLKQSLAIAYSMKRKGRRQKAYGGDMCAHGKMVCGECHPEKMAHGGEMGVHRGADRGSGHSTSGNLYRNSKDEDMPDQHRDMDRYLSKKIHHEKLDELGELKHKDRKYLARGGMDDIEQHIYKDEDESENKYRQGEFERKHSDKSGVHEPINKHSGRSITGSHVRALNKAEEEGYRTSAKASLDNAKLHHEQKLGELSDLMKKNRRNLSEGGFIEEEEASGYHEMPEEHEHMNHMAIMEDDKDINQHDDQDIVSRIMKKYSEGGRVANATPLIADFEPNEFDDLVKDDDLSFHYTGANSGDEIGNEKEDNDRHDIVSRIMRSTRKKDRMPRPA